MQIYSLEFRSAKLHEFVTPAVRGGKGIIDMKKEKKTCCDCLHCKVSAKSSGKCRLCFCSETKKKVNHKEIYWFKKKPCNEFEDMGA
jgi:hypothetical protein